MDDEDPWEFLVKLDEELLIGGVILSEWCSFIVRDHDTAFAGGAYLSSILTAVSGIETYLRSEYGGPKKESLHDLINSSPIMQELKDDLRLSGDPHHHIKLILTRRLLSGRRVGSFHSFGMS